MSDDQTRVETARRFLERFGTPGDDSPAPPKFVQQCEAMLAARPSVVRLAPTR